MTKLTNKTMPFNLSLLFIIIHVLALPVKGTVSSGTMHLAPGILVSVIEYTELKSERDSIMPCAVNSSFKTDLQIAL
jgi:hypothetical protein